MLKIFTTQLVGKLNAIGENEDIAIEDASRLIAQTIHNNGNIYVHGFKDCSAIHSICHSENDRLPNTEVLYENNIIKAISPLDCVIICTTKTSIQEAVLLLREIKEKPSAVILISSTEVEDHSINELFDVHIQMNIDDPIVPMENGKKIGVPISIATLHVFYCLYLTTIEILLERQ